MELGDKLKTARQEKGLSQRQLCEGIVTRNMLSLIEHGTAKPSMDTMRLLAARLEKPVSWFLEEDMVISPNQTLMARAMKLWEAGEQESVWVQLKAFQLPDPVLEWQWRYLSFLAGLGAAEKAMAEGKHRYALQLLEEVSRIPHGIPGLERKRLLMLARFPGENLEKIAKSLPSLDEELMLRAEAALGSGDTGRAAALLEAAEDRQDSRWNLLRGRVYVLEKDYPRAAACLEQAEDAYPEICRKLLEVAFREMGDFKRAYEYACKRR